MWDSTKGAITRPLNASNAIAVSHQYDVYGNRALTTDGRGVVTSYSYDELNRIKSKSYTVVAGVTSTPAVTYSYDGAGVSNSKGRLTGVSTSESVYSYEEYDGLGRVKRSSQTTAGTAYQMSYSYDVAGNMTSDEVV